MGEWRAGPSRTSSEYGDHNQDDAVKKTGYLWKKGERRKVRFQQRCSCAQDLLRIKFRMTDVPSPHLELEEALVRSQDNEIGCLQDRSRICAVANVGHA
jgi:hypothetical protein